MVQGKGIGAIQYVLVGESGPDHNKSFQVCVKIAEQIYGEGCGHTKKAAEQEAAYQAILKLRENSEKR